MDDEVLRAVVQRACEGDPQAFADLYENFARRVLRLCRHLLGSPDAAEDAASEVFLRAQRTLCQYNGSLPFGTWLLSIASHYCIDLLRRRNRERRLFEPPRDGWIEPASGGLSPLARLLAQEEQQTLRAALRDLPERLRVSLILRYEAELSYDEIAAQLGLNRNHVATLIFRAKGELRRALGAAREREP